MMYKQPVSMQVDVHESSSTDAAGAGKRPDLLLTVSLASSGGATTSSTEARSTNMVDGEQPTDATRHAVAVGASEPIPIKG